MQLGVILETNDAEKLWNGFRLANKALANDHEVRAFLLGDGVEAPDVETEKYNAAPSLVGETPTEPRTLPASISSPTATLTASWPP